LRAYVLPPISLVRATLATCGGNSYPRRVRRPGCHSFDVHGRRGGCHVAGSLAAAARYPYDSRSVGLRG
ncbi:unnamed protein product, partial [Ectocarpus sp. 4 AP-2014]